MTDKLVQLKDFEGNDLYPVNLTTQYKVNRNLLDNWYFIGGNTNNTAGTFPINQRGQGSYTSNGYGIDRWRISNYNNLNIEIVSSGLTLKGLTSNNAYYNQYLTDNITGRTITASILLTDGTFYQGTGVCPSVGGNNVLLVPSSGNKCGLMIENHTSPMFTITLYNKNITVVAVKLELGATQTLAHQENGSWVLNEIPDYNRELEKCNAYLVRFGSWQEIRCSRKTANGIDFIIPTGVTMAKTPTIIGTLDVRTINAGNGQGGFTFSVRGISGGYVHIRATKTSHGLSDGSLFSSSYWYLSAEP